MQKFLAYALGSLFAFGVVGAGCTDNTNPSSGGGDVDGGDSDGSGGDAAPTTGDGGGPGFSNSIQLIVEPSDNGDGFVNAVKNAKSSVHMTMYLLTDSDVINALIAQRQAGHDVKVVLNQQFPSGQGNSNANAFAKLQAADANMVVYAPSGFTYTHEKCAIVDGTTAWIMTMNATFSSPTSNREFLAVDTDSDDVKEADAIFQADFANQSITPDGKLLVAPTNDKGRIRALIGTAASTLDLEVEELSDSDVTSDLAAAADRGVKIRIVLADSSPSSSQSNAVSTLKSHGASIVTTSTPYIHAKAIVVDGVSMYVGSANLTQNSMSYNRELALVTTSSDAISAVENAVDTDFGNGTAQ